MGSWFDAVAQISLEDIEQFLRQFRELGPLPGIAAPMIEAFLPVLPLVAIIVANVNTYDLWLGFLLSWIGVTSGAMLVFLLARRFGGRFRARIERKYRRFEKFIHWIEHKGFTPIFILACFPFTPSSIVNIVSGISRLPVLTFFTATLLGKGIMIFLVSYAGNDIAGLAQKPWKIAVIVAVFTVMWFIGRKVEARYLYGKPVKSVKTKKL